MLYFIIHVCKPEEDKCILQIHFIILIFLHFFKLLHKKKGLEIFITY